MNASNTQDTVCIRVQTGACDTLDKILIMLAAVLIDEIMEVLSRFFPQWLQIDS